MRNCRQSSMRREYSAMVRIRSQAMVNTALRKITRLRRYTRERALTNRFGDKTNSEDRLLRLVQKLHLPFGVLFQAARKAAEEVATDLGHLGPGGLAAFKFGPLIGRACIAAVADPKKIQRHDCSHGLGRLPAFSAGHQLGQDALPRHARAS